MSVALHQAALNHAPDAKNLSLSLSPQGVHTLQEVKKVKGLKLIPLGAVSMAKDGAEPKWCIEYGGQKWVVSPWKATTSFDDIQVLVPFWWCKGAASEPDGPANMEWGYVSQDGIKIPCLQNSKALGKHEALFFDKEQVAPGSANAASSQQGSPVAEPKSKRRKKT